MKTQNLKNTIKAISKIVKKRSSLLIIENVQIKSDNLINQLKKYQKRYYLNGLLE